MIPDIYQVFPELEYDSWVTIGLEEGAGPGETDPTTIQSTEFSWINQFESGGELQIDDEIGGSWYVLDPNSTSNAVSGDDQKILIMQLLLMETLVVLLMRSSLITETKTT